MDGKDKTVVTTLGQLGEKEAIRRLTQGLPLGKNVVCGPGDDCAVIRGTDEDLVLTSDPVIEGIHFTPDAAPRGVGHKAVGRALSDLAAMGAVPTCALIDVVAPGTTPFTRIEGIYAGATRLAERYGLSLVGGDLSEGSVLELHVFAMGRVPSGTAVLRSGARAGDVMFVTGALGGSAAGRHLAFDPRIREGIWLRENRWARALIDVSDGLATDLRHIIESSHVGATLNLPEIPLSAACTDGTQDQRQQLDHALYDGEDFELLFTVAAENEAAFAGAWSATFELPCTPIGGITDREGELSVSNADGEPRPLAHEGYQHFSSKEST